MVFAGFMRRKNDKLLGQVAIIGSTLGTSQVKQISGYLALIQNKVDHFNGFRNSQPKNILEIITGYGRNTKF